MSILEFQHVSKVYHNTTRALDDLSFFVNEGEFVSIIGPSGAGKSTILRCINRLIDATEGKIIYDGEDIMSLRKGQLRNVRTKTGMIFQHYNLVERLSVMENVLHGRLGQKSTFSGMIGHYTESEKEKAFSILSELGLADQAYKRCDALSGGQKQRVGIARAIMQEPKLILCDEPIASLDPKASKTIMDHLAQINQTRKITCIVNLHQVDVAMKYSQRILGIAAGKLVFDGTPSELTQEKIHEIYQSNAQDLMLDMQGDKQYESTNTKRIPQTENYVYHRFRCHSRRVLLRLSNYTIPLAGRACRIPESISLDRSESDTGCTGDSAVSENHGQADRNSAAFCGGNGNCRCVCICAEPVRFRVHRPQLHHETHRANHCCLFPECSRCGLGNASDVFLWAEHPDRIFRPVLYHIRNADPCVYRNH